MIADYDIEKRKRKRSNTRLARYVSFFVINAGKKVLRISKHPEPPSSHLLLCQLVQKRGTIYIMHIIVPTSMCPDEIDFIAGKGGDIVHCRGGVPVLVGGGG